MGWLRVLESDVGQLSRRHSMNVHLAGIRGCALRNRRERGSRGQLYTTTKLYYNHNNHHVEAIGRRMSSCSCCAVKAQLG
jgi:hypothetical protein